jgi:hypothetical protein
VKKRNIKISHVKKQKRGSIVTEAKTQEQTTNVQPPVIGCMNVSPNLTQMTNNVGSLVVCHPAPNASPSTVPTGTYRETVLSR